jgi:hypothetical protein
MFLVVLFDCMSEGMIWDYSCVLESHTCDWGG